LKKRSRKKLYIILLIVFLLVLSLFLGSCKYLGFINQGWTLQGTWKITQKPDTWEWHTYFVFLENASGYQIQDSNRAVLESGIISNLTDSSFDYQMDEYTPDPTLVGSKNYVEYTLTDTDTITMTFYADREKSANFGTITAARE